MKKMVAGAVLCLLVFVGFLGFQVSEKSKQKEFYQEAAVFFEEADYKKAIQYLEEAKENSNLFTGSLEEEIAYYQAESHMNLEEYEEGFFSNFEAMLNTCLWIGIVLLVVGLVIYFIGKKTEGPKLKALQAARKQHLDEMIRDLHDGKLPGEECSKKI